MGILDGKVAIVTGAGQGIGQGVALALGKEGAAIAIADLNPETAEMTAQSLRDLGGRAMARRCDVGARAQVNEFVAATAETFGTVNILVNAARSDKHEAFEEITDEAMDLVFRSAVYGTLYFMQACFPYMKRHGGKIINFGSGAGTMGVRLTGSYAGAKEAIRGFTKVAAIEWGPYRINVNTICPRSPSPEYLRWFNEELTPDQQKREIELVPLRYDGDPERDIGRAVVFLAGPDSDYITSRTLHVDGGRSYYDR